ncbi:MAG: S9 family peptidase [Gammaproteobacteria bacterium]
MLKAPQTAQHPYSHEEQGSMRSDPYHWLQDRENPAVIDHLKAENAYTDAMLAPYKALQQTIYQETLSRIQETDQDYPWPYGDYEYYFRTVQGLQHDIFCRRLKNGGAEEILFDENVHAEGFDYFEVGQYALNLTQDKLAISIDTDGDERYDVYLGDMKNALIKDIPSAIVFSTNNHEIWYTRYDETQRPYQVWCHDITGNKPDELLYEENDERFTVGIYRSLSDAFLIVHVSSKLTSEAYVTDASTPRGPLRLLCERKHEHEYDIDHHGDYFYIRTNEDGKNFSLKRCPINDFSRPWETVLPVDAAVPLIGFSVFSHHIVLECRRNGLSQMATLRLSDFKKDWITFDEPAYTIGLGDNWEFNTQQVRLGYVSMTTPACDYAYDMNTHEKTLLKQSPVLGDFNAKDYTTERIFANATDGTKIPISLVYKTALKKPNMPMVLTAYGAYGIDNDPQFSYSRLSLLNRGYIYGVAHIRGGGEFGDPWHEAGRFLHKKNTFTDFIACSKHLINEQYTSSNELAIIGGSAGGLLIGAVINLAPELFKAAVAQVPFVDVLNTMLDDTLPLTVLEYEEWGNPHDKPYYDYMKSYAPYENVTNQAYPTLLVTAGLHDPRVPYWEAAKWVARLREHQTAEHPILLRTQMSAGHQGPSGRYSAIEEVAEEFAFVVGFCRGE